MWRSGVVGERFSWRWLKGKNNLGKNVLLGASVYEPRNGALVRYGVAQVRGAGRYLQMAVLVQSEVLLDELPKRHAAGDTVTIRGRILVPVEEPRLYVADATAAGQVYELTPGRDGAFEVEVQLASEPGRYFMEIQAAKVDAKEGDDWVPGRERLALCPLYVGMHEPTEPEPWVVGPVDGVGRNPEEWPAVMLGLYNAERETFGLAPLKLDADASEQAAAWAERLAGDEVDGYVRGLAVQLRSIGCDVDRVEQANASFFFPTAQAKMSLQAPRRRSTYLDPDVTSIGIGIVRRKVSGGLQKYQLVEYLITPQPPDGDEPAPTP